MGITTGATAAFGVSKLGEIKAANDERKARREVNRTATAAQQIEDRNNKRQLARERRIQQSQILSASEASGSENSSREVGAVSTLNAQSNVNISNISRQQNTALDLSRLSQDIADARTQQQIAQQVQGAAKSVSGAGGGFDNLFAQ